MICRPTRPHVPLVCDSTCEPESFQDRETAFSEVSRDSALFGRWGGLASGRDSLVVESSSELRGFAANTVPSATFQRPK